MRRGSGRKAPGATRHRAPSVHVKSRNNVPKKGSGREGEKRKKETRKRGNLADGGDEGLLKFGWCQFEGLIEGGPEHRGDNHNS